MIGGKRSYDVDCICYFDGLRVLMATRYYDVTDPTPKTEKIAAGLDVVHSSSTRRRDAVSKVLPLQNLFP